MKRIEPNTTPGRNPAARRFFTRRDSLLRTVVFAFVIVSLVPVFGYATVSYYRSRAQIQSLVARQMTSITSTSALEIEEFAHTRSTALETLLAAEQFSTLFQPVAQAASTAAEIPAEPLSAVQKYLAGAGLMENESAFDQILITQEDGKIILASNSNPDAELGQNFNLKSLLSKDTAQKFTFSPDVQSRNPFALITARKFETAGIPGHFAAIGISTSQLPALILKNTAGFYPEATSFYFLSASNQLLALTPDLKFSSFPTSPGILAAIQAVSKNPSSPQPNSYVSQAKLISLSFVKSVPSLGLYLVLEVPNDAIFVQNPLLDPINLGLLGMSITVLAILAFMGTTQVVNPLINLNRIAKGLAEGNFKLRAKVNRRDEVGQLADSMNRLGEELSTLYATMEDKVEQRTAQLRTASEVARLATSATRLEDTLKKTVELVNERFEFYHTAIYLVDETGTGIILKEASGETGEIRKRRARRILFSEGTFACWVAAHNQPKVIQDLSEVNDYPLDDLLPETHAQALIPIAVGSEVLGVIDIYSKKAKTFDSDIVFVLQTLANQIASALQNSRILVAVQVDLEETALLYKVTRQITEASDEKGIHELILKLLPQIGHTNAFLTLENNTLHILGLFDAKTAKMESALHSIDIPAARFYDQLAAGQPIFVQDITQPSNFDNILSFFLRRGCKSAAIFPSLKEGKAAKVFILGFREEERVSQAILQPFTNLSEVITTALDKFAVLKTLQQRLSELQILANFSKATASETDIDQLYHILHDEINRSIGSDVGFLIAILNHQTNQVDIPIAFENNTLLSLESLPLGSGLTSYVIQNRTPLLLTKDTERKALEMGAKIIGKPAQSWLGVPLIVGGELIGALVLQDHHHEERFNEADLNLFITLAPQIATSIRTAQLATQLNQARQNYQEEHLLVTTWLENAPELVTVKNAHGHITRASQSVKKIYELTPEELIGKSDFDLMEQEKASQILQDEMQILRDRQAVFGSTERILLHGAETWLTAAKIPIVEKDQPASGILSIRQDITDLKAAESDARRRADEILTSAEIARDTSSTLDVNELLGKAVNLIRDRFGFYHASIFLLDPLGKQAVLRESTGEAGREMKKRAHQLEIGSASIVGTATERGVPVIVNNVADNPIHYPNPLLPNTRAEMAIPLKTAGRVLGALDVQSEQSDVFGEAEVSILGILSDQLAVALVNAELFAKTQDMLGKHRLLHQITVAASTSSNLGEGLDRVVNGLVIAQVTNRAEILLLNRGELELAASSGYGPADQPMIRVTLGKGLVGMAAEQRRALLAKDTKNDPRCILSSDQTQSELALPILFGDEVLGVLNMEADLPAAFDENDQEIMIALVNNIGAVIANWRLVTQIRRQVERQQILFTSASKIRRSSDIATILQTSVNEIGRALGVQSAHITLVPTTNGKTDQEEGRE